MAKPSITWTILTALATKLGEITVANGYLTDAGQNVWTTDGQRPDDQALGLAIYSESIIGSVNERPGKPVREFHLLVEFAIGTDLDNAQELAHQVIEDIDVCVAKFARAVFGQPSFPGTPPRVADVAILDRPEGEPVIAGQVRIVVGYARSDSAQ